MYSTFFWGPVHVSVPRSVRHVVISPGTYNLRCGGNTNSSTTPPGGGANGHASYIYAPVKLSATQDANNTYSATATPLSSLTFSANTEVGQISADRRHAG